MNLKEWCYRTCLQVSVYSFSITRIFFKAKIKKPYWKAVVNYTKIKGKT